MTLAISKTRFFPRQLDRIPESLPPHRNHAFCKTPVCDDWF